MLRAFLTALALALSLIAVGGVASAPVSALQEIDDEVPPGNPVIGDERPGDIEPENRTRYGLWALVAVCLIVAGVLLVKIERWERSRA